MIDTSHPEAASGGRLGIVGDIGGTNCRLASVHLGDGKPRLAPPREYKCADYPTAEDCIRTFLQQEAAGQDAGAAPPCCAVLAAAGPVLDGVVTMTNNKWRLDEKQLSADLGLARVKLINDFAAQALAMPLLGPEDTVLIGPDVPGLPGSNLAIMGPGTGFGLAALAGGTHTGLLVTEGGHIAFAPSDDVERQVLHILAKRYGRVSIERILAGQGMADLHSALEEIEGRAVSQLTAAQITEAAKQGDHDSIETLDRFCAILGAVAGDLTLALGAQGGVFIGGGIAPRLLKELEAGPFRARFEDKGRFVNYMKAIPTRVITANNVALRGVADELTRVAATMG
jgi:glucokinase